MTVARIAAAAVLVALLGACAAPERIEGSGRPAAAPGGFQDYCRRHPEDPTC
jgi:predicted transglutaminase-like cysteine proteinase